MTRCRQARWLVVLAVPTLVSGLAAQSPMFRGGPAHLGVYDSPSPSLDTVVWKFKTEGRVISTPAVVGELVYVGSTDGALYAVHRSDGTQRWKFETEGPIASSPAASAGRVYVSSLDGNIYAVDAATGHERWRHTTGNDTTTYNQIGIASSAAVVVGAVFVGARDGHFHVVDARTGTLRWTHDNQGGWTIASSAVRNGVVYFPTSDGRRFKALDAAAGVVRLDLQNAAIAFPRPS